MNNIIYKYALLLCFTSLVTLNQAFATHIVGGELNYTCLGNDQYEITLTVYRDCEFGAPGAWFDDPASIGIFNDENELITELGFFGQIRIPFPQGADDTIHQELTDPCFVIPPNVCVHTYTYRDTVNLPFREGGYTLVYQRCCRNQTLLNIVDPLASGATYLVRLSEETLLQCNSNAKFKDWPPIYICVDEPIDFDHGAIDPDGDSLVYKLCTPLLGATQAVPMPQPPNNPPYDSVVWVDPPYSLENMLGGVPLSIDSETGFLTGIPNTIGQFVVGVCVEEYRDGELISITRRDFQYNVGDCERTVASFFTAEFYCEDEAVFVNNQSENSNSYQWFLDAPGYTDSVLTGFSPLFEGVQPGTHILTLIAANEKGCMDTFSAPIVVEDIRVMPDFDVEIGECSDSIPINLINQSTVMDTGRVDTNWYQIIDGEVVDTTPPFYFTSTDSVLIILELVASNGCNDFDSLHLASPFFRLEIPDTLEICNGESVFLYPSADPECEFMWSPSDYLDDSTSPNPVASPPEDILYTVTVSKEGSCDYVDSVYVKVLPKASITSLYALEDSVNRGDTNRVFFEIINADSFFWDPAGIIIEEFPGSIDVELTGNIVLNLIAIKSNGCNDTASLLLQTVTPPCEEPYVFIPNAFSPNGDDINDEFKVRGKYLESVEGFIYNRWGEKVFTFENPDDAWDGYHNGKPAPMEGYGYYIQYQCEPGGMIYERKGNLTLLR